ncbi:MAG: hypothetical protein ACOC4H_02745 [bacterium]
MKKILIPMLIILSVNTACSELSRSNPTDPQSDNYIGITYKYSIGDFTGLADFTMDETGHIFAIDAVSEVLYKYMNDGTLIWSTSSLYSSPTGICTDNSYVYMVKSGNSVLAISTAIDENTTDWFSFTLEKSGGKNIQTNGSGRIFVSNPQENIIEYYTINGSSGSYSGKFGPVLGPAELSGLVWIRYSGGKIFAGEESGDITVIDAATGSYIKKIDTEMEINFFTVKNDAIIIPSAGGVSEFSYTSGSKLRTWGDFGNGSGRINAPGPAEKFNNDIYIGTEGTIKKFGP